MTSESQLRTGPNLAAPSDDTAPGETPRTVQLIVNPTAGSASRRRLAALRRAFEEAGARVILSESRGTRIAPEADHVCVVGGDGTIRHAVAAIRSAGRPITLSIYPAGTVNLVARECGYRLDPAAFVRRAWGNAPQRRHYYALIADMPLFGCASVGPDSHAVANLSLRLKRAIGRLAYVVAFLQVLRRWPRPHLRLVSADRDIACEAVYVAKGRFFAGPWSFAPEAAVDRPGLHVVALRRATRRDFARFVWTLWRGRPLTGDANIVAFECTALNIEGAGAPVQIDGDIAARLPVAITMREDTLTFA